MGSVALDDLNLEHYRLPELRKHQTAIAAEIALRQSTSISDRDAYLRLWHDAIMEVWATKYGCKQPYPQWRNGPGKTLAPHMVDLEAFALRFFLEPPRKIEIHPARVLIVECVVTWMTNRDLPIMLTHGTLAKQLQNAGTAVNSQLPGYNAAGFLPMALKLKGSA